MAAAVAREVGASATLSAIDSVGPRSFTLISLQVPAPVNCPHIWENAVAPVHKAIHIGATVQKRVKVSLLLGHRGLAILGCGRRRYGLSTTYRHHGELKLWW